ncbi:MAG: hypothetical protein ACJ76G_14805 [Solirubrobacterales bacterium]
MAHFQRVDLVRRRIKRDLEAEDREFARPPGRRDRRVDSTLVDQRELLVDVGVAKRDQPDEVGRQLDRFDADLGGEVQGRFGLRKLDATTDAAQLLVSTMS